MKDIKVINEDYCFDIASFVNDKNKINSYKIDYINKIILLNSSTSYEDCRNSVLESVLCSFLHEDKLTNNIPQEFCVRFAKFLIKNMKDIRLVYNKCIGHLCGNIDKDYFLK